MPTCDHFNTQLQHLTTLAKAGEGWLPYVRKRAKDLEHDPSGLWAGLIAAIAAGFASTAGQGSTKPD